MPNAPEIQRRVVVVPGNPLIGDAVYYIEDDGLLVAKLMQRTNGGLHILASNVTLNVLKDGTPTFIEVEGDRNYTWGSRDAIEASVPVRPGRVVFEGPLDYGYWFDDPAIIASDREGSTVVVEFDENSPSEGIRISPSVTVLFGKTGRLSAFLFRGVVTR